MITAHSTYLEAFTDAVRQRRDVPLFTFLDDGLGDGVTWTYADVDREARRVAGQLVAAGAVGSPVLLMTAPGLDYLAGFYGCMYAGAIAVPAYPPSPMQGRDNMQRLQAVADNAGVSVGLTTEALLPVVGDFEVGGEPMRWLSISRDGPEPDLGADLPAVAPGDVAFLQYTSGSTGNPKGVVVTQGNLIANTTMIAAAYGHRPDLTMVSWLPPYHDMGLIGTLLTAPVLGMRTVFMPPAVFLRRPVRWLQVVSRFRAEVTAGPNFAYESCIGKVKDADLADLDLSCLEIAINGAEPVRPSTVEGFVARFGPRGFRAEAMRPSYGLAETTLLAAASPSSSAPTILDVDSEQLKSGLLRPAADPATTQRLVASGPPAPGSEIRIVDEASGRELPDGQVGEILVTGDHVAHGYWRAPELSAERFDDRTLRTGDLGAMVDGELVVTGRIKDVLIIRGRNYYPHDIELTVETANETFRRGSGVAFTVERDERELLVVVQEVNPGLIGDPDAVMEQIRRAITTTHAINAAAIVLTRPGGVPKTSSGKVRRNDTKRLYEDDQLEPVAIWRQGQPTNVA